MKTYTIKPLKWEKYVAEGSANYLYSSKTFDENDALTISESDGVFEVTDEFNNKEYKFKTFEAAQEKAQQIWEKELSKNLKEVKLAPGHQF